MNLSIQVAYASVPVVSPLTITPPPHTTCEESELSELCIIQYGYDAKKLRKKSEVSSVLFCATLFVLPALTADASIQRRATLLVESLCANEGETLAG